MVTGCFPRFAATPGGVCRTRLTAGRQIARPPGPLPRPKPVAKDVVSPRCATPIKPDPLNHAAENKYACRVFHRPLHALLFLFPSLQGFNNSFACSHVSPVEAQGPPSQSRPYYADLLDVLELAKSSTEFDTCSQGFEALVAATGLPASAEMAPRPKWLCISILTVISPPSGLKLSRPTNHVAKQTIQVGCGG